MKNLRVEVCNQFCSPCNEPECDECPLQSLLDEFDRYESIREAVARVPLRKHAPEDECRCGAADGSYLCTACEKVLEEQLFDERIVKSKVQDQLRGIATLLGVGDAEEGVTCLLEQHARLKDAVNSFPLGLLMSADGPDGKVEHRFINLTTMKSSPAYPTMVQALLAGHKFYTENNLTVLQGRLMPASFAEEMKTDDCDG